MSNATFFATINEYRCFTFYTNHLEENSVHIGFSTLHILIRRKRMMRITTFSISNGLCTCYAIKMFHIDDITNNSGYPSLIHCAFRLICIIKPTLYHLSLRPNISGSCNQLPAEWINRIELTCTTRIFHFYCHYSKSPLMRNEPCYCIWTVDQLRLTEFDLLYCFKLR